MLAGLARAGFTVVNGLNNPEPDDLLVIWNRYGDGDQQAARFERAGAAVIVAENGYVGARDRPDTGKPLAANGEQLYAMSLHAHNGAGRWYVGEHGRTEQQGIQVQPWREDGDHILLICQRGIGTPPVAAPRDWLEKVQRTLSKITTRPIRVRGHPGNAPPRTPLARDLEGAWCAMTWASAAGIRALAAGVPVFSDFGQWIGHPAATPFPGDIEAPNVSDVARETMLNRVAWAQWSVSEIGSGESFKRLMALHAERQQAA